MVSQEPVVDIKLKTVLFVIIDSLNIEFILDDSIDNEEYETNGNDDDDVVAVVG